MASHLSYQSREFLAHLTQQGAKVLEMVFKVFEEGKDRAVAYAWTEPGAGRIGINLRWLQSGLTLKPYSADTDKF